MRHLQAAIRALCLGMILPLGAFLGLLLSTSRDAPPPTAALAPVPSESGTSDPGAADRVVTLRRTLGRAEIEERRVLPVASRIPATQPTFERAPLIEAKAVPTTLPALVDHQAPLSPARPVLEDLEESAASPVVTESLEGPRLPSLRPRTIDEPHSPGVPIASRTPAPKHTRLKSPRTTIAGPETSQRELPPPVPEEAFAELPQVALVSPPTLTPPDLDLDAHPTPNDAESDPTQGLPPLEPPDIEELAPSPPKARPAAPPASHPVPHIASHQPQKLPTVPKAKVVAPPRQSARKVVVDATVLRVVLAPTAPGVRLEALARDVAAQTGAEVQIALLQGDRARIVEALKPFGQPTVVSQSSLSAVEGQPALFNVGRRKAGGSPEQVLAVRIRPQVTPDGAIRLDVLPERFLRRTAEELRATASNGRIGPGETLILAGLRESSLEADDSQSTYLVRAEWLVLLTPRLAE